jgi:DMSO/TMAO reductase YedYZ molybdopterin-dependent catalytic subunit
MKTMRSWWYGAAAGCAFVVVELLGRVLRTVPTLPELIQDRLVLLLPGPIFSLLLDRFLYLGKPLLFATLLLGQVAFGGLAGMAIGRWGRPAAAGAALWLLTGLVVLPLANRSSFAGSLAVAVVTGIGYAAYALTFALFAGHLATLTAPFARARPRDASVEAAVHSSRFDRRRLLVGGLLGVSAVVLARRAIGRLPSLPPRGRALASGGSPVTPADAIAQQAQAAPGVDTAVPGLPPSVTPADRFYVVSKNLLDPELDGGKWRLRIDGLVGHPLDMGYADLAAMPSVDAYRTLECISNEIGGDLVSNGLWSGVPLADLLRTAEVQPSATMLHCTSADGYTSNMPVQQALDASTLLAFRLNGAPLPFKHGYPVRMLGTGTYGMKNPKWLTRIELVRAAAPGFWQQQGWDEQGIIQTMSQIVSPGDGDRIPKSAITIAGIAFAGARGIDRVEITTDSGATWNEAQILPSLGPNTWTFWQHDWQPPQAGSFVIAVRAADSSGTPQTPRRTDPFPSGATGYHQVRLRVSA